LRRHPQSEILTEAAMPALRPTVIATAVLVAGVLTDSARAATVTLTPAALRPGGTVHVNGSGFARRARATVQLGAATQRAVTDSQGRVSAVLAVAASAPAGPRRVVVRVGPLRVATRASVSRNAGPATALAALSGGERLVLEPTRAPAGTPIRLRGSGFRDSGPVEVRFGAVQLGIARPARGSFTFRAAVPDAAVGVGRLTAQWDRGRVDVPFAVSAGDAAPVVVGAAGDIACPPNARSFNGGAGTRTRCAQGATARVLAAASPAAVLPLGDTQYGDATLEAYAESYTPSWGRFDLIAHPVPGDEEYEVPGAPEYYKYFGAVAGEAGAGYYSFDVGAWHLIALNSECDAVACGAGSAQEAWLRADLATSSRCTLAYWHRPRFTSGVGSQATETDAFWRDLYAAGADVVLGGHHHQYERFAPQTPDRKPDPAAGIRQFVAGTGGESLDRFQDDVRPNSEARIAGVFGVLLLTLRADRYDWRFVSVSGAVLDAGSAPCH
jgi:acid phosphatase type 7